MDTILPRKWFNDRHRACIDNIDATVKYALGPAERLINMTICEGIASDIDGFFNAETLETLFDAETGFIAAEKFLEQLEVKTRAIDPVTPGEAMRSARITADINYIARGLRRLVTDAGPALEAHARRLGVTNGLESLREAYLPRIEARLEVISNVQADKRQKIEGLLAEYGQQKRQDSPAPGP